jgi:tetraacyldisaccharide 4'-kinase
LCDDGLQHYALRRDIELIVMDERQLGNGHLLPMGPLREGAWRLATVEAIVHNGEGAFLSEQLVPIQQQHRMTLVPGKPRCMSGERMLSEARDLNSEYERLEALAGIGNPQRFFDTLDVLGVSTSKKHAFNDHHKFVFTDIPLAPVIMTEKDAVKVKAFAHPDAWYLPVSAALPQALYDKLEARVSEFESQEKIYGNKY